MEVKGVQHIGWLNKYRRTEANIRHLGKPYSIHTEQSEITVSCLPGYCILYCCGG